MPGSRAPKVRVAIVTLDNHLKAGVERADARLREDNITVSLHAATDWDRQGDALAQTKAAVAAADIVIVTMLFLDDHIRAILPTLEARRESCDAMVCLMSSGEVVKLTRMGGYRMDAPAKGPLAMLKKLRGSGKPGASSGAGQMRMLRRLPKILRFIPGTAQDVRAYFLTLQYWLAGSDDNVVEMTRALIDRYAAGERLTRRGMTKAAAPREYPELGVYHPRTDQKISDSMRLLPPKPGVNGTVGLLLLRSYLISMDAGHYDGMIAALEAAGLRVIPGFANGLDSRPVIEKFYIKDGKATVDAVISLTGFSLVGGPAYNDAKAAEEVLTRLDVPYIAAHPLEFQTLEQWGAGRQGLLALESTIMVSIPELDGATQPTVFGGRSDGAGVACAGCERACVFEGNGPVNAMRACPERAEALAEKVVKVVALRRAERATRKLAITIFNFPPNAGATGSAAFLAVFESLHATLRRLADEGYAVEVPESVDALRETILKGNSERFGSDANVAARIDADDHVRREPHLAEIEAQWGPAPGKIQSDGSHIHVLGAHFGNVFIGVQPTFGYEGDPMRLLFDGDFAPTHAFAAYYRWLREDFGAHAVIHFGTHGALEYMPGKQTGLTGKCWPERLLGDLPNFYLFASNNPSEGLLAKRRSGATMLSYLTPPLARAGLYKGFVDLKTSVERWRSSTDEAERAALETLIWDECAALDITAKDVSDLSANLYELERTLIPHGLHVLGERMAGAERAEMIDALADADPQASREGIEAALDSCDELGALVHALDGGYIRPAPGGDLLANPEVLPTGRNIHGFDPFRLPTRFACEQGRVQAESLLTRHAASGEPFPESLAMVLWGTDNMKSEGSQIAQVLSLMGARPRIDSYGRLAGAELIPLGELGRPRIDVVVTLSGIFRDLLPLQTRMLAEAALLATQADEPLEMNFVRKHSLAHQKLHDCDLETAALRVFSNAEGAYGANVNQLIEGGVWADPDELANAFETRKGYAYGVRGAPVAQRDLLRSALKDVDFVYQNLESVEVGITDLDQYVDGLGGVSRSIARAKGSQAPVYIVDATVGDAKVRTLAEQIDLETRTRTLNPKWFEGMLKHGFEGVRNIEQHVTNTVGWSATTGQVAPWVYQQISETFVLDPAMRERLSKLNPNSSARVAGRLLEACERRLWEPDDETLEALRIANDELEDRLEGVYSGATAAE
ncbi:magnesium chelatase subunit H [Novosphingobium taihuense]|uniref:magnesium chelatase n=1 Tax=Novosphingobium taihuense TaxID=260085 RepID=A0A7W7EUG2_9SPHN|nr:magnesium chelatase subunit H [Novosphingobium taihuense]MBB4612290.1 magnesium chelatase subunit H [Novosphingobium taihuense]TWH88356.1 cobaltochelatase CobN subunit [Novosphingobium taihuense]